MSAEKGSSKADTLVKMVLVFFISLLSFSVGTFVGKQVSDSDHRRLALEGEFKGGREVASADEHAPSDEHGDKISEKEVESLTEEFVNKEKGREIASTEEHGDHPAETSDAGHGHSEEPAGNYKTYEGKRGAASHPSEPAKPAHDAAPAPAKGHAPAATHDKPEVKHETAAAPAKPAHGKPDGASQIADKVAKGKAPSDGKPQERKPNAVLPSVASAAVGKFSVQVAAYADEKQAKDHAADLKGKGWNAFYLSGSVNGHTWFRVLVGLFENSGSAEEFKTKLVKESGTKSAFVQKIVQ